ncbi:MAG: pseudouridylate synthase [Candidatus Aphodosoma sp.]
MVQFLQLLDIDLQEILPQRQPFIMIDSLVNCGENEATTLFTVKEDNIFVKDGTMLPTGLIENMAQTCAARLGYRNTDSGEPARTGVIGAISNLHVERTPQAGETVATTIKIKAEAFGMTAVKAESRIGGKTIATAELKIAISQQ